MHDANSQDPMRPAQDGWFNPGRLNAQLVYCLYLISFVVGITGIVGLIMAYVNRGKGPAWVDTHYTYAIRTFWIGMLYSLLAVVAMFLLMGSVGMLLMLGVSIWVVVRCVIGLQKASAGQPVEMPDTWWI